MGNIEFSGLAEDDLTHAALHRRISASSISELKRRGSSSQRDASTEQGSHFPRINDKSKKQSKKTVDLLLTDAAKKLEIEEKSLRRKESHKTLRSFSLPSIKPSKQQIVGRDTVPRRLSAPSPPVSPRDCLKTVSHAKTLAGATASVMLAHDCQALVLFDDTGRIIHMNEACRSILESSIQSRRQSEIFLPLAFDQLLLPSSMGQLAKSLFFLVEHKPHGTVSVMAMTSRGQDLQCRIRKLHFRPESKGIHPDRLYFAAALSEANEEQLSRAPSSENLKPRSQSSLGIISKRTDAVEKKVPKRPHSVAEEVIVPYTDEDDTSIESATSDAEDQTSVRSFETDSDDSDEDKPVAVAVSPLRKQAPRMRSGQDAFEEQVATCKRSTARIVLPPIR